MKKPPSGPRKLSLDAACSNTYKLCKLNHPGVISLPNNGLKLPADLEVPVRAMRTQLAQRYGKFGEVQVGLYLHQVVFYIEPSGDQRDLLESQICTSFYPMLAKTTKLLNENAAEVMPRSATALGLTDSDVSLAAAVTNLAEVAQVEVVCNEEGVDGWVQAPRPDQKSFKALPPPPPKASTTTTGGVTGVAVDDSDATLLLVGPKRLQVRVDGMSMKDATEHFRKRDIMRATIVSDGHVSVALNPTFSASDDHTTLPLF